MSRSFPGSLNHIVAVGDTAALDITGTALTISAWFNWNSNGTGEIVSKSIPTVRQYRLMIDGSPGKLKAGVGDGGSTEDLAVGATTVSQSVWHHGLLRKNGTGANALQAWLNGVSDASITSNVSIGNTSNSVSLGQQPDQNTSNRMIGQIAQVGIWNVALTDLEIVMLSRGVSPFYVRPSALRVYWPLWGSSPEPDWTGRGSSAGVLGTTISTSNPRTTPVIPPSVYRHYLIVPAINDSATVYLDLTASGSEIYEPGCFIIGDGEAQLRWGAGDQQLRWLGYDANLRWDAVVRLGTGQC